MDLTPELVNEVINAAKEIDYGTVMISISGKPDNKVVDIITEKRRRFKRKTPVTPESDCYQVDNN